MNTNLQISRCEIPETLVFRKQDRVEFATAEALGAACATQTTKTFSVLDVGFKFEKNKESMETKRGDNENKLKRTARNSAGRAHHSQVQHLGVRAVDLMRETRQKSWKEKDSQGHYVMKTYSAEFHDIAESLVLFVRSNGTELRSAGSRRNFAHTLVARSICCAMVVSLVTGASGGIGFAVARRVLYSGHRVAGMISSFLLCLP
jgi:hypothetical protein